ncbi:MAG: histidine phosphatase family protein, partial [Klebsiella michiganensis]|nr:histidine phosphatase family protein [Klebsiella michiganensis]
MKLILVRHAETEWNLEGIIQGHSDSSLTCRG